jgi:hypothetical protein
MKSAFAANMAVLFKDGVKRTISSRYPTAIIADLRVLASAPKAMTLAGLGDCCARFVAYGDWYLAGALGMVDFYSEVPLALLGSLEAARLYQHFLNSFEPEEVDFDSCYPDDALLQARMERLFAKIDASGAMARECWSDYSKKLKLWRQNRQRFEQFCSDWRVVHRPRLSSLVCSPEIVTTILPQAGALLVPQDLEPPISQEEYDFALEHGHFIRVRFVLGDLLYFLGW